MLGDLLCTPFGRARNRRRVHAHKILENWRNLSMGLSILTARLPRLPTSRPRGASITWPHLSGQSSKEVINFDIDYQELIAHIRPSGPLSKADFKDLARAIDPVIADVGELKGLLIETEDFPGWQSLGALVQHLAFVRGHHKQIQRIALVTDATLGVIAEKIASHFVVAEIKQFHAGASDRARAWIATGNEGELT